MPVYVLTSRQHFRRPAGWFDWWTVVDSDPAVGWIMAAVRRVGATRDELGSSVERHSLQPGYYPLALSGRPLLLLRDGVALRLLYAHYRPWFRGWDPR